MRNAHVRTRLHKCALLSEQAYIAYCHNAANIEFKLGKNHSIYETGRKRVKK